MTDVTFRPTRAPRVSWCFFCRRAVRFEDVEARRVDFEGREEWLCGTCVDHADVGPSVPLDYMEEDDEA